MSQSPAFAPTAEVALEVEASAIMSACLIETPRMQATTLAEQAASDMDHDEWLDEETHWIWDLALAMSAWTRTQDLKLGDTIKVWWAPGRDTIIAMHPYTGPLLHILGEGTMLADFALNPTGMTLESIGMFERVI